MSGDFESGAQRVRRKSRRKPLEPRAHVPPLGVVIIRDKGIARLPGRPRLGAARLAQASVAELDPRPVGPLAQNTGGGIPKAADLLGFAGFGQELADGI